MIPLKKINQGTPIEYLLIMWTHARDENCHGDDYVQGQIFIGFEGSLAWMLRKRLQPEVVPSQKANNQ